MVWTGCQCFHVISTEGACKTGILKTVQDANTGWGDKYLCDPNMLGLTQNMEQNVSSIVIDMGISHDAQYQQVETATWAGMYGVPVTDSDKVAKYWTTQLHTQGQPSRHGRRGWAGKHEKVAEQASRAGQVRGLQSFLYRSLHVYLTET